MPRIAIGVIKAFTSGDRMHFDRKNRDPLQVRPTARLIVATNNLPPVADQSGGLWRRVIVVPFGVVIPPERQDRRLVAKLLCERPGIFNWAIEGLARLRSQGRLTEPAACLQALRAYQADNNPIRAFLQENVEIRPNASVASPILFAHCLAWCENHDLPAPDCKALGKQVWRYAPAVGRQRGPAGPDGARVWIYVGIGLKPTVTPPE